MYGQKATHRELVTAAMVFLTRGGQEPKWKARNVTKAYLVDRVAKDMLNTFSLNTEEERKAAVEEAIVRIQAAPGPIYDWLK